MEYMALSIVAWETGMGLIFQDPVKSQGRSNFWLIRLVNVSYRILFSLDGDILLKEL